MSYLQHLEREVAEWADDVDVECDFAGWGGLFVFAVGVGPVAALRIGCGVVDVGRSTGHGCCCSVGWDGYITKILYVLGDGFVVLGMFELRSLGGGIDGVFVDCLCCHDILRSFYAAYWCLHRFCTSTLA